MLGTVLCCFCRQITHWLFGKTDLLQQTVRFELLPEDLLSFNVASAFKASPSCTNYLSIVLRSSEFPRVGSSGCFSSKSSFPSRIQGLTEFHEKKRRKMFNKILGQVFPRGSAVKDPPANAGDMGWFPGLGRSHTLGQLSLGTTRTEPTRCKHWTPRARSPCSAVRELTAASSSAQP